jgi:hypothetical protein
MLPTSATFLAQEGKIKKRLKSIKNKIEEEVFFFKYNRFIAPPVIPVPPEAGGIQKNENPGFLLSQE